MPASFTHHLYGQELMPLLDEEIQTLILNHKVYYDIGLQGPDILYYNNPMINKTINKIGQKMHHETYDIFLKRAFTQIDKPEQLAYLIGMSAHYLLDSRLHPYIISLSKKGYSHFYIEKEIDLYYKDLYPSLTFHVSEYYHNSKQIAKDINELIEVGDKIIYQCIRHFNMINPFIYSSSVPLKKGIRLLPLGPFKDMITISDHKIDHHMNAINKYYQKALKDGQSFLPLLIEAYKGKEIPKRFKKNFI